MASRALEVDYAPLRSDSWVANSVLASALQTRPRRATVSLETFSVPVAVSETGEEIRVEVKPDRRGHDAALEPIQPALEAIKTALALEQGWDSYGARQINRRAVRPTIELILAGNRRCAIPRVVPTAEGGFQLHWLAGGDDELEITVRPDGGVEYIWFGGGADEADDEGDGLISATQAIARFCSLER